jgi:hypothetical protein
MTCWILDIETNVKHDDIRLVGIKSAVTGDISFFMVAQDLREFCEKNLKKDDVIVTHNGVRFDFRLLASLWSLDMWDLTGQLGVRHTDTLLVSKMIHPDISGGHSLRNLAKTYFPHDPFMWKQELPEDYPDWESFYDTAPLPELAIYLKQDLHTTWSVYCQLIAKTSAIGKGKATWAVPMGVEKKAAEIVNRQVDRAVTFNIKTAKALHSRLSTVLFTLEADIDAKLPTLELPEHKWHNPPKLQFRKDGTPSINITNYCTKYGYEIFKDALGAYWAKSTMDTKKLPLTKPLVTSYKLSVAQQAELKDWLMSKGWKPTMWNTKKDKETGKYTRTSPRLTDRVTKEPCPGLEKIGFEEAEKIARWLMIRSRVNLLQSKKGTGLIPRAIEQDGVIPSDGDTLGANTSRWTHKGIVNIPRPSTPYGKALRSLFTAREGLSMVGWDASSLEACMEAHYTYPFDPDYAITLTEGTKEEKTDVHSLNKELLDLPSRDFAKTFKYAVTYGAKPKKLAEQLGVSISKATMWYDDFWDMNIGLAKFRDALEKEWEFFDKKYILGLDGRLISTRSKHSLVNAKFQSAGAIVMKYAMMLADSRITKEFPKKAFGLIRMHDEEQWECLPDIADSVGRMGVQSIRDAGKILKLNVPLDAEYSVGSNWADTH